MRIGNGFNTPIWDSPWIPDDGNFKLITPGPPTNFYPWRVSDLINPITATWDYGMLERYFWPVDRARILGIPLGDPGTEDRLVWHYSNDGRYSVRSCYHMEGSSGQASGSSRDGMSGEPAINWQVIWSLNLPPKIRVFMWRACKGFLPHMVELFRRHIVPSPICASCGIALETSFHVFLECRGVAGIWRGEPFNLPEMDANASMWTIFSIMKARLSKEWLLVAVVICWKIWHVRNNEVHGGTEGFPSDLLLWAKEFVKLFQEAQGSALVVSSPTPPQIWVPPDPGLIKINVDAAFPNAANFFRISLVARNSDGVCLRWIRKELEGRPLPSEGEAVSVLHGVQEACARNWRHVIIETDCLPVYRYLVNRSSPFISFGATLDACLSRRSFFDSLVFSFVKRSGNILAHLLATDATLACTEGSSLPSQFLD